MQSLEIIGHSEEHRDEESPPSDILIVAEILRFAQNDIYFCVISKK